jgi:rare lipoprotein A
MKSNNVIFLLASIAFVSSQSTNLEKKSSYSKDTLKKIKQQLNLRSKTDSLFASLGKFKIYKKEAHALLCR